MTRSIAAPLSTTSRALTGGKALLLAVLSLASVGASAHGYGYSDRGGIERYRVDLQFSGGDRLSLQSGPGYVSRRYSGYPPPNYYPPAHGKYCTDSRHHHGHHDNRGHDQSHWNNGRDKHRNDTKHYYSNNWNRSGQGQDRYSDNRFHDGGRR